MRAALCGLMMAISLLAVGCHHNVCRNGHHGHGHGHLGHRHHGCNVCGNGNGSGYGHGHGLGMHGGGPSYVPPIPHGYLQDQMAGPGGPPSPTVAYPYYTTRAPRDFLLDNPPSIGP